MESSYLICLFSVNIFPVCVQPAFFNNPASSKVNTTLAAMAEVDGFQEYLVACMRLLTLRGMIRDLGRADGRGDDGGIREWDVAFGIVLSFFHETMLRFHSLFAAAHASRDLQELEGMLERWQREQPVFDGSYHHLRSVIYRLRRAVDVRSHSERQKRRAEEGQMLHEDFFPSGPRLSSMQAVDGPGELSLAGRPRHDNDHVDISAISVAPTMQEVLCKASPYLPHNHASEPHHLPAGSVARHVDIQFRLLRHDLIAPLWSKALFLLHHLNHESSTAARGDSSSSGSSREEAMGLVRADREVVRGLTDDMKGVVGFSSEDMDVYLLRDVRVLSINTDKRSGVYFLIDFLEPPMPRGRRSRNRLEFWENTRRLQNGSLVCLWIRDIHPSHTQHRASQQQRHREPREQGSSNASCSHRLVFATITARDTERLATARPQIGVQPCGGSGFSADLLGLIARDGSAGSSAGGGGSTQVVMLEAHGSFFAYEPILKALQGITEASLPFAEYICGTPGGAAVNVGYTLPAYITAGMTYDLSLLLKTKAPSSSQQKESTPEDAFALTNVPISNPTAFPIDPLLRCTSLDEPQAVALQAALTQEFALLQGPPGTGKTFVGIKLVEILLSNALKTAGAGGASSGGGGLGPILCVCFTNHALDQFLEGLIASGIRNGWYLEQQLSCATLPSPVLLSDASAAVPVVVLAMVPEQVVRVGGRSRCESLQQFNLATIMRDTHLHHSRSYRQSTYEVHSRLKEVEAVIRAHSDALQHRRDNATVLSWRSIAPHLLANHPGFFYAFHAASKADDDGFQGGQQQGVVTVEDLSQAFGDLGNQIGRGQWEEQVEENEIEENRMESVEVDERSDRGVEELLSVADPWATSAQERRKLLEHWVGELRDTANAAIEAEVENFSRKVKERSELQQMEELEILERAQVVGMTTSGVAKMQRLITALGPRVVIVEEAAEVLEAHILTSLTPRTQHVILIGMGAAGVVLSNERKISDVSLPPGDHLQLRPKVEVYELSKDSHKGFDLDVSLFERLALSRRIPVYTLATQRRMRPEIADLIRCTIYPALQDHPLVHGYPDVRGMAVNLHFWDHDCPESGLDDFNEGKSKSNDGEAAMLVGLATYLLQQGYTGGEITILTPYVGQLLKLRQALSQGEESTVVIISLVRNNMDGKIGFLKSPNRTNVLLSRAKHGMYIIGNASTMRASSKSVLWPRILTILQSRGRVGRSIPLRCVNHSDTVTHIGSAREFREKASEGGCSQMCGFRLTPCGHTCPRRERVEVTMPLCGHKQTVKCSESVARTSNPKLCTARCGAVLSDSCGHTCISPCGHCIIDPAATAQPQQTQQQQGPARKHRKCMQRCERPLPCGHLCPDTCHSDRPCSPCTRKCLVSCQHSSCPQPCHRTCAPCAEPCGWRCIHQGACSLPCGAPCDRLPCEQRCEKTLKCGHQCPSLCAEKCPSEAFCTAAGCGSAEKKGVTVDLVTLETLGEIDPDESPVLVLGCGHAYTVDTLDGHMGLNQVYLEAGDGSGGVSGGASGSGGMSAGGGECGRKWVAVLPFEDGDLSALKGCPECRQPITGLRRYGRMVNKALLDQSERKFALTCLADQEVVQRKLARLSQVISSLPETAQPRRLQEVAQAATRLVHETGQLCVTAGNPPTQQTYQASVAALQRRHYMLGHREVVRASVRSAERHVGEAVEWAGRRKAVRLEARARLELVDVLRAFVEGHMAERLLSNSPAALGVAKRQQVEYLEKAKAQCVAVAFHSLLSIREEASLGISARKLLEEDLPALEASVRDEPRYFALTEREKGDVYRAIGLGGGHCLSVPAAVSASDAASRKAFSGEKVAGFAQSGLKGKALRCESKKVAVRAAKKAAVSAVLAEATPQQSVARSKRADPKSVVSVILGGGAGTRLFPLTKTRAKPAVPIGGAYRLIDVPMSNCINSGINKVYILTQFNSASLNRHLARTYNFGNGVNFGDGFVEALAATQTPATGSNWFQGTADAVRQFSWLFEDVKNKHVEDVVILSGDHLYRMDYMDFVQKHKDTNADITISVLPMDDSRASDFGLMKIDESGRVVSFAEKPKGADLKAMEVDTSILGISKEEAAKFPYIASMGIYVFKKDILLKLLRWRFPTSNDFGGEIIPASAAEYNVQAYLFDGYWEDIGTIKSFFDANLNLTDTDAKFRFYDAANPIYTSPRYLPPTQIERCQVKQSIISHGCFLRDCTVNHCIVGIRSRLENGVNLKDTMVVGADFYETDAERAALLAAGKVPVGIGANTTISNAIVDKNARIGQNVILENKDHVEESDRSSDGFYIRSGITVVLKNATIADGTVI
ncbi:unnamed protein product [Closterium sp. Yama58-4]|nr:unnamed protein product [Closterium sp. Yama58-4]